jgi:hypothetical protein
MSARTPPEIAARVSPAAEICLALTGVINSISAAVILNITTVAPSSNSAKRASNIFVSPISRMCGGSIRNSLINGSDAVPIGGAAAFASSRSKERTLKT